MFHRHRWGDWHFGNDFRKGAAVIYFRFCKCGAINRVCPELKATEVLIPTERRIQTEEIYNVIGVVN